MPQMLADRAFHVRVDNAFEILRSDITNDINSLLQHLDMACEHV
jgi:hypothetical protein